MHTRERKTKKGEVYKAPNSATENAKHHEHLLSVLWNMMKHLARQTDNIKHQIAFERFLFKFLEEGKLKRLLNIFDHYGAPLLEFDIASFKEIDEIEILEQDFELDLLCHIACMLTFIKHSALA